MSTGSRKSLHFGVPEDYAVTAGRRPPRDGEILPCPASVPALNALLAMGDLLRDDKTVGEQLRVLHLDENSYHGNLQVILSALKRMSACVAAMIEQCEGS